MFEMKRKMGTLPAHVIQAMRGQGAAVTDGDAFTPVAVECRWGDPSAKALWHAHLAPLLPPPPLLLFSLRVIQTMRWQRVILTLLAVEYRWNDPSSSSRSPCSLSPATGHSLA